MKKPTRRTDSTNRPKAKYTQTSGYGTNNTRRAKSDDSATPKAKRPQRDTPYGADNKRREKSEDETSFRRKPKAVFDGGERPSTRRSTRTSEEEPRRRSTNTEDSATPRRGSAAKFRGQDQDAFAKPRRERYAKPDDDIRSKPRSRYRNDEDKPRDEKPRSTYPTRRFGDDNKKRKDDEYSSRPVRRGNDRSVDETRPKDRSRYGNEDKSKDDKPRGAYPARRFGDDTKKRKDEGYNSQPVRRGNDRSVDEESNRLRRGKPSPEKSENTRRFATKSKGDVKKNFRNKPVRTPDYNFAEIESKRKKSREDNDTDGAVRLNRYIANAGVCSRRDADLLIQSGEIKVNGKVVNEMGYQVKPNDVVKYGSRVLNREKMVYVLLNKPKDFITTTEDPEERRTVMDLVKEASGGRLFPVGRLDRNTTGLLLITNDGELSEKLTHPSYNVSKIYEVHLDKPITSEDFDEVVKGVELEDGVATVDDLAIVTPDRMVLGIELHLGRNRIVRRIFEHLGYEVIKLDRVMYAGLTKKDLPRGKWRYLSEKELIRLKYFI